MPYVPSLSGEGNIGKLGPCHEFLITIRDRFQQPVHVRFRTACSTFPELNDAPSKLQQFVAVSEIPFHVLLELQTPEVLPSGRGGGIPAPWMPVPETAMNEYADAVAGEHQIGSSRKLPRMQTIPEAVPMQQSPNLHFRQRVATANPGHHARPDFFADYIHDRNPDELAFQGAYSH